MNSKIDTRLTEITEMDMPNRYKDTYDYLIVGAGFPGSVAAQRLAVFGKKVMLCDNRPYLGGNAHDRYDDHGILIHPYGPHIFHTNSTDVFNYLSNFTKWREYEHRALAFVDEKLLPIPVNLDTVNRLYNWKLSSEDLEGFFRTVAEHRPVIRTAEDAVVSRMGLELYEKLFRNYTLKQWGVEGGGLDRSVTERVSVRTNCDDRYFTDTYQTMPLDGFTAMFENMLSHPNITVELNADYRELLKHISAKQIIYTGPIDAYFDFCLGRLPYRSIKFKFENHPYQRFQPVAAINYPNEHEYTRITEFKHLTGQKAATTTIVYEFPHSEGEPYYPIATHENQELYRRYQLLAHNTGDVHFIGSLATYKHCQIDQEVAQALSLAGRLEGPGRKEVLEKTHFN